MILKDLIKKVEQINKLNNELEICYPVNLVISNKYSRPITIYKAKDLKKIEEYFVSEVAYELLHNEIEKVERYIYKVVNTTFVIQIEM